MENCQCPCSEDLVCCGYPLHKVPEIKLKKLCEHLRTHPAEGIVIAFVRDC
jgi:hypothetical protein